MHELNARIERARLLNAKILESNKIHVCSTHVWFAFMDNELTDFCVDEYGYLTEN